MAFKINGIKYPAADRINGRTTTLNRSMANTLMHRIPCSPDVEAEWIKFFPGKTCAYCGDTATQLDHLYPLIDGKNKKRPSGYGTDPGNLVPCCSKCNQPKGKQDWETFMRSDKCKHIGSAKNPDPVLAMEERIQIIKDFQKVIPAKKVIIDPAIMAEWDKLVADFEAILKKVVVDVNELSEQLYVGLPIVSSIKVKTSMVSSSGSTYTVKRGAGRKYTDDDKYKEAAYYLKNNVGLKTVEKAVLGLDSSGNTAQNHLNGLGIDTSASSKHKGLLIHTDIDDAIANAVDPVFKNTLEEIKKRGL